MTRPVTVLILFSACFLLVCGAMVWVTSSVLHLDREGEEARSKAALEENVRLALWRMDSSLAPIIARETARPYFAYSPFYPAERAYTKMFAEIKRGEVLIPSPLLTDVPEFILFHFQFSPDDMLTSPQVPIGNDRDLAEAHYITFRRVEEYIQKLATFGSTVSPDVLKQSIPKEKEKRRQIPIKQIVVADLNQMDQQANIKYQSMRSAAEMQARQKTQQAQVKYSLPGKKSSKVKFQEKPINIIKGMMSPVWINDSLLLARKMKMENKEYLQGCKLDWPGLRTWLSESIKDILPEAKLEPVKGAVNSQEGRLLAALPVRLIPGYIPIAEQSALSPAKISLAVAWIGVLFAGVAIGVLLFGTISLSERRGAFVSAVTHELRTPLTTFRMYSEMLAEGMISDETKREKYLKRLSAEADRLSHLVENVLAYARLEKGGPTRNIEDVMPSDIIDRVKERLTERASQAEMELQCTGNNEALSRTIKADISAVEQILFNLVDNACKYASSAGNPQIAIEVSAENSNVLFRVCDNGPGIASHEAGRLFRPFSKSAREAAHSAPGVGLGLALSRRLAKAMGGDLSIDTSVSEGACFVLSFPKTENKK
ncbi:sensor histidine kinase [Planctomycetota bacterium]